MENNISMFNKLCRYYKTLLLIYIYYYYYKLYWLNVEGSIQDAQGIIQILVMWVKNILENITVLNLSFFFLLGLFFFLVPTKSHHLLWVTKSEVEIEKLGS